MSTPLEERKPDREADTRERLLKAALRVFADKGIAAATLREITEEAGANVAAVNYYFRSKEELTASVLATYLNPINQLRLQSLQRCIDRWGAGRAPIEQVVEALVRPMVELSSDEHRGRAPIRLLQQIRALPSPATNRVLSEQFDEVHSRFLKAISAALPALSPLEVALRYDFARGAVMQVLGDLDPVGRSVPGVRPQDGEIDNEVIVSHLVRFIIAGMSADHFPEAPRPETPTA